MSSNFYSIRKGVSLHPQASVAGTPSDGDIYYDSTVGKFQFRQASAWKSLGSGASGSGKNFFSDFDAELIAKVTTYNDSAAIPVDLTGGTVTGLTTALETTTPLTGTKSYKFSKDAANRQGQGFAILTDETLDYTVKQGESVTVKFKYKTSANYVSGDVKMYVYRVGSNTLEALNGVDGLGAFGNSLNADQTGRGEFTATISCSSSDTAIRVGFHVATTNASAYDLTIDNVFVGTASQLVANVSTVTEDWVPTFTGFGTVTLTYAKWYRDNEYWYYDVKFSVGTSTATTASMSLPTGLIIDPFNTGIRYAGEYKRGVTNEYTAGATLVNTANGNFIFFGQQTSMSAGGGNPLSLAPGNNIATSGDIIVLNGKVKIQGWSAGNTISSTQANFQNVTAKYTTNTAQGIANAVTNDFVDFEDKVYDDFNAVTTGGAWKFTAPVKGLYSVTTNIFLTTSGNWNAGELVILYVVKNGGTSEQIAFWNCQTTGSHQVALSGSLEIKLEKGDYIQLAPYQNSGASINLSGAGNENWISITQIPDMTVVGISGAPSEVISASLTTFTNFSSYVGSANTWGDPTSITLTPGEWDVEGTYVFYSNGATTTTNILLGISTTSGNSSAGLLAGTNHTALVKNTGTGTYDTGFIPTHKVTVTSTTVYYLKAYAGASITNLQFVFSIRARRIR